MAPETMKPTDIDQYIAGFPLEVQEILENVRKTIKDAAPEAEETISYQMPTFRLEGNLVHFAAYKNHLGFYPTPSGIENFKEELAGYRSAKGSVQFPFDRPVPYELISRITDFRRIENLQNAAVKKRSRQK